MDFRTAPCIVNAIKARADQGIFGYTWRPPQYFEAIAAWQYKRNGWMPETEKMAFAPGVVPGMRMILTMFTQPGDKVIIQQPVYHPFADVVNNTGRTLVVSPLKRNEEGYYTMDYADFEEKARGTKYFILCNPHNPVGRVWTPEELNKVGDICVRHGVEIISDEIHSDLMLDGNKHTCMASVSPEIAALTTTCVAPSKTFNLAGLQSLPRCQPRREEGRLCGGTETDGHCPEQLLFSGGRYGGLCPWREVAGGITDLSERQHALHS